MILIPRNTQALIFDFDGTIIDSMPIHFDAWRTTFEIFGRKFTHEMFISLAGVTTKAIVEHLNREYEWQLPVVAVSDMKESAYARRSHLAGLHAPVVDLIREKHLKIPMAIATGERRDACLKLLTQHKLHDCFDAIVTADDVVRGKPAPDIFIETARRLGVQPQTCCVLEDGDPGITAAQLAQMNVIDVRQILSLSQMS